MLLVEVLAGLVVGLALLVAASALLQVPRRRPRRQAPPERPLTGALATAPRPVPTWADPARHRPPDGARRRAGADGLPVDARTSPLDVWDVAVVVLIVAMALSAPVVGQAVAAVVVPCLLLGTFVAIRVLADELQPPRDGSGGHGGT